MVANTGPQRAAGAEGESAEDPRAVATIARLIHELYASSDSHPSRIAVPDDELINWSEMLGAVRGPRSPT
jgi:hypothetical protein